MQVDLIDHMGTDLTVVNAARVSFDKESEWGTQAFWDISDASQLRSTDPIPMHVEKFLQTKDVKLIEYLATHGHWTPFSHVMIQMRETVPIFVARQRFKHMVGFTYNEVSRRYVSDEPTFFTPDSWRRAAENKKQGSSDEIVESPYFLGVDYGSKGSYNDFIWLCTTIYKGLIEQGVAPEQARMVLPQSMYTSYYVTGSLAAWARAYNQRSDDHAQKEIQDLAAMWDDRIRSIKELTHSWEALIA